MRERGVETKRKLASWAEMEKVINYLVEEGYQIGIQYFGGWAKPEWHIELAWEGGRAAAHDDTAPNALKRATVKTLERREKERCRSSA